jgi:hypothetical protein
MNYIYFCCDSLNNSPFSKPNDIYIDSKLLNSFLLVFTDENGNNVLGQIKQKQELPDKIFRIPEEDLNTLLNSGSYDIYCFKNNELVIKKRFIVL